MQHHCLEHSTGFQWWLVSNNKLLVSTSVSPSQQYSTISAWSSSSTPYLSDLLHPHHIYLIFFIHTISVWSSSTKYLSGLHPHHIWSSSSTPYLSDLLHRHHIYLIFIHTISVWSSSSTTYLSDLHPHHIYLIYIHTISDLHPHHIYLIFIHTISGLHPHHIWSSSTPYLVFFHTISDLHPHHIWSSSTPYLIFIHTISVWSSSPTPYLIFIHTISVWSSSPTPYLSGLLHPHPPFRTQRSLGVSQLTVSLFSHETAGKISCSVTGPTVCTPCHRLTNLQAHSFEIHLRWTVQVCVCFSVYR